LMIVNAELFSQYEKSQNEDNEMMRTDEEWGRMVSNCQEWSGIMRMQYC
jgi:hypothetical protein